MKKKLVVLKLEDCQQPVWQRQPLEGGRSYARFEFFLSMGPHRDIAAAYRKAQTTEKTIDTGARLASYTAWKTLARNWAWPARAQAWAAHNRQKLALRNEERRIESREERIRIITEQLAYAERAITAAALDQISIGEAREMLPTLRLLLRDMLEQQRIDLEPLATAYSEDPEILTFTADEFAAAKRELDQEKWGLGLVGMTEIESSEIESSEIESSEIES